MQAGQFNTASDFGRVIFSSVSTCEVDGDVEGGEEQRLVGGADNDDDVDVDRALSESIC